MLKLDHKSPVGRHNNAIIIQTWIRQGVEKSGQQIQAVLEHMEFSVSTYCKGKLKLACDWRRRMKEQLGARGLNEHAQDIDLAVAKSIYNDMFHYKNCGRKRKFPDALDKPVLERLVNYRRNALPLNVDVFRTICMEEAARIDNAADHEGQAPHVVGSILKGCSHNTFRTKLIDLGFKNRTATKSEGLPFKSKEMGEVYIARILSLIDKHNIPPALVLNLDETSIEFVFTGNKTYEFPSVKQVHILGSNDKRAMTYTPVITSDGQVITSQVILPGISSNDEEPEMIWQEEDHMKFHTLLLHHSGGRKQWQNQHTFHKLLTEVNRYVENRIAKWDLPSTAAVLVLDCAGSHTSTAALEMLEQFPLIKAVFIPPKMTSVLQPLDKEFFAPFKKLLKYQRLSNVRTHPLHCHHQSIP
eukprot:gb/GECG01008993.1/.p1 GENE.gb/GECG01008993.1/~~gb/GECG01008993.1/.p1  ORF type:complete len:414 (+),score=34.23 gb/GECG01008993.1/:1-1242(+)